MTAGESTTYIAKALLDTHVAPDFLQGLGPEERERVLNAGQVRRVSAGDLVFSQGEPHSGILVIREGKVRSFYVAPSGREITLAYWSRGHFVGGPEVLGGGFHTWSGEATMDSELLFLSASRLRRLIIEIPQFALNVVEGVAFKGKCFSAILQLLGTRPVGLLLAQLLATLARDQGGGDRVTLDSNYSQEELAKMVGGTRQWVASTLKRFRRDGLIEMQEGRIVIPSITRLEREFE